MLKRVGKRTAARRSVFGLIIVLIVLGVCFAGCSVLHRSKPAVVAKHDDSRSVTVKNGKDKIKFTVKADKGLSKDSTPTIAHITGGDSPTIAHITGTTHADGQRGKRVDFYHAIGVTGRNSGSSTVRVPAGSYTVRFVSPVNRDGSVFRTSSVPARVVVTDGSKRAVHHTPAVHGKPTAGANVSKGGNASKSTVAKTGDNSTARSGNSAVEKSGVTAGKTDGSSKSSVPSVPSDSSSKSSVSHGSSSLKPADIEQLLAKIPANKITNGVMLNVVNDIRKAIEKGDGSLQGDNCKKFVQQLVDNVKANPNVSQQTVDAAKKVAGKTGKTPDSKPEPNDKPVPVPPVAPKPVPVQPAPKPAPVAPKPVPVQPAPKPAPVAPKPVPVQPAPKPAPVAPKPVPVTPKPKFKTVRVWVPNKVTIVDVPAHTIEVEKGEHAVFSYDGVEAYGNDAIDKHAAELLLAHHPSFYSMVPTWVKQEIPAKTHVEDHGHWETRQVPVN